MLTLRRFFATLGPGVLWLAVFLIVPVAIMFGYSLLTRTDLAQVGGPLTLESWGRVFGYDALFREWVPDNLRVLGRSVLIAGFSTLLCVLMGYPLAFYIARQPARRKSFLLLLLIIPFWTNFLIRVYAWILILRPFDLVPSLTATFLGMVYAFLPFFRAARVFQRGEGGLAFAGSGSGSRRTAREGVHGCRLSPDSARTDRGNLAHLYSRPRHLSWSAIFWAAQKRP